jgi:hypothetical protein
VRALHNPSPTRSALNRHLACVRFEQRCQRCEHAILGSLAPIMHRRASNPQPSGALYARGTPSSTPPAFLDSTPRALTADRSGRMRGIGTDADRDVATRFPSRCVVGWMTDADHVSEQLADREAPLHDSGAVWPCPDGEDLCSHGRPSSTCPGSCCVASALIRLHALLVLLRQHAPARHSPAPFLFDYLTARWPLRSNGSFSTRTGRSTGNARQRVSQHVVEVTIIARHPDVCPSAHTALAPHGVILILSSP